MIKLITVIGARPQFIKAAAISRAIRTHFSSQIKEVIVHTGQHYDESMSQVFFQEMGLPKEDYNLSIGSGSHSYQTGMMMIGIEEILVKEKPDALLLYGDTNSTLAAAVAAAKLHIPIVHVEGGVRSFNKKFPEEINRLICDHLSTLVFVPTVMGVDNLYREGFDKENVPPFSMNNPGVFLCGDIMYDNSIFFSEASEKESAWLEKLGVTENNFVLLTMHRPSNVDDVFVLTEIVNALLRVSQKNDLPVVFPVHPRTRKIIEEKMDVSLKEALSKSNIHLIPPVSFIQMTLLEKKARIIFTDSGGVQKEAYFFEKPCVILLEETPWPELIESGTAELAGSDGEKMIAAFNSLMKRRDELKFPPVFGDGKASEFICEKIIASFS